MIEKSQFKPAWWLKNNHLQTIAAKLLRKNLSIKTVDQTLTLADGDFLDISWTELPIVNDTRPLVVLLHGLEGSKNSHYAKGMLSALKAAGYLAVLMHFRGCSGRPNNLARAYHSGDIRDISFFTDYILQHYPSLKLALVGFSLGGNVTVRYLAECPNNPYQAAVVICAPLDLASCSEKINSGSSKIYQHYLLKMLKDSTKEKIKLGIVTHVTVEQLDKIDNMWQFDQNITAPLNCFADALDYYQKASGKPVLEQIKQNCLILHAQDDPFLSHKDILIDKKLPENIRFEVSQNGGHVGFVAGMNPFRPVYWLEKRVMQYLAEYLPLSEEVKV